VREFFALAAGYLLGSVLPAYLIGRARGLDLRSVGRRNAGTMNAYDVLGLPAAIVTALYDVTKGLVAMLLAHQLGLALGWAYAAGVMAIVGHRVPFYLRGKGATGMAPTVGLLLYAVVVALTRGWLGWLDIAVLGAAAFVLGFIFRQGALVAITVLPVLYALLAWRADDTAYRTLITVIVAYILVVNVRRARRSGLFSVSKETGRAMRHLRVLLRPLALAFPVMYLFLPKQTMLLLVGSVTLFFITLDVVRLVSRRANVVLLEKGSFFFRRADEATFSSATLFLCGSFLAIFLFSQEIATTALVYLTVGDTIAKFIGLEHGRTRVFTKTLEGSLAHLFVCASAGFAWSLLVPITPVQYLLGAVAATLTELAPLDLNDNFTVPIVSGVVMTLPLILW